MTPELHFPQVRAQMLRESPANQYGWPVPLIQEVIISMFLIHQLQLLNTLEKEDGMLGTAGAL